MTTAQREKGRSAGFWVGGIVLVMIVAVLLAGGTNEEPLDPRSVAPDGAKGLADLVDAFAGDVELGVGLPDDNHDVALLLDDTYGVADRRRLEAWVRDGGRLLVADQTSPLTPARAGAPPDIATGSCVVPALREVTEIAGATTTLRSRDGALRCVGGTIVVEPLDSGIVVSLGGPTPLLNDRLDDADNAVFAVAVLAPTSDTRVAFLEPALPAGAGGESLIDLVADPVWLLLIQIGVAFLLFAWWRARRLGTPVREPVAVKIEGAELATARGALLESMQRPDAAVAVMRADTHRSLARALGMPGDTPVETLADRMATSRLADADSVRRLLAGPYPDDAPGLLSQATELADLRSLADGRSDDVQDTTSHGGLP